MTHAQTSPVTLITGGAGGIGAATARRLLGDGHRVVVTGRSADRLAGFAAEVAEPDRLLTAVADAADADALAAAVDDAVARFGALTGVVANAGFSTHGTILDTDADAMREMVLTNVLGPALLVKVALPALVESGGRIVFVGSTGGLTHSPGNLYSVTKWAVTALAENTRLLATGQGVGVTLVAPGRVDTAFWDTRTGDRASLGPLLTPERIADTIAWVLAQPAGVDVNTVAVRPLGQTR